MILDYLRHLIGARAPRLKERGASAAEYGLLIAGVAALIVAAIFLFDGRVGDLFSHTCTASSETGC